MDGQSALLQEPATDGASAPGLAAKTPAAARLLALSVWCGLIAGPLEVGAIVGRKETFDINRLYWMSRHFVWLIPLTDLLVLLALGVALSLAALLWPRRGNWLAARLLCAFTFVPMIWAGFPEIYAVAGLIFALGIAALLTPILEQRALRFGRFVRLSFPLAAAITPIIAASLWATDRLKERRQESLPLPPPGSPSVLLIVLDTVGAGHLSLHGYERPTSPTLDALARRGIRFDRVQAASSWTLPSHASLFTGRWPHELSAGWLTPLDAVHPTLADHLGARGYATAAFVANTFYCGRDSGLDRGFARYQDYIFPQLSAFKMAALVDRPLAWIRSLNGLFREHLHLVPFRDLLSWFDAGNRKPAAVVNRQFLDWLSQRRQPERPFFVFLNFYDVHYPYQLRSGAIHRFGSKPRTDREMDLIENWRTEDKRQLSVREVAFVRDSYDDCVADLDEQLGRLIDELERRGVLERTWVIITSDHGESFGEHPGDFGHGTTLYQTQLHVPFVVLSPSPGLSGRVVGETVSLRDLPATIVDLLGHTTGSPFPGESLARFFSGSAPEASAARPASRPVLSEVVPTDPLDPDPARFLEARRAWAALADAEWIYIRREGTAKEELFQLGEDSKELHNLAGEASQQPRLARMRDTLDKLIAGPLTRDRFNP